MNTKEKILASSLELFSVNGYKSVSVRDIASKTGIKASSLYNHFENKQDIFNQLVGKGVNYTKEFLDMIHYECIDHFKKIMDLKSFHDNFVKINMNTIKLVLNNNTIIKLRKLLIIEQFNNPDLSDLFQKIFVTDVLKNESEIFNILIKNNLLRKSDPEFLALQFYSPIFLILYNNKEAFNEHDYNKIEKHIFRFKDTYGMKG